MRPLLSLILPCRVGAELGRGSHLEETYAVFAHNTVAKGASWLPQP